MGGLFCQNADRVPAYQRALDQGQLPCVRGLHANHIDPLHRLLLERLLCTFALDFDALSLQSGVDVRQRYAQHWPALRQLHADGVILLDDSGLRFPRRRGCWSRRSARPSSSWRGDHRPLGR